MWEPSSWAEAINRLAELLGGREDAEEWLREAVRSAWREDSIRSLPPADRALAFQRTRRLVVALEEDGVPDEWVGPDGGRDYVCYRDGSLVPAAGEPSTRARVAACFERCFEVPAIVGPPWAVSPTETDRPTREEWSDPFASERWGQEASDDNAVRPPSYPCRGMSDERQSASGIG